MQPDSATLKMMFGESTPIGDSAKYYLMEDLLKAHTLDEYTAAVCDYAEALHSEQYDYYMTSPYGGEDISVSDVESIAMSVVSEVFPALTEDGIDITIEDFEDAIYSNFLKSGREVPYLSDFIKTYEDMQKIPEYAEKELKIYQQNMTKFERDVSQAKEKIKNDGKAEIKICDEQIKKLNSQVFLKLFSPKEYRHQLEQLEGKRAAAMKKANISDNEFFEMNTDFYPPFAPEILGTYLVSEEDLNQLKKESSDFLNNPLNQNQYQRFTSLLEKNSDGQSKVQHKDTRNFIGR